MSMRKTARSAPVDALSHEVDLGILESGDRKSEVLVKSSERVKDIGEVFTPAATVNAMLDQLPVDVWSPHPSSTFFEPGCGDGNFLVAILERKLSSVADAHERGMLAAGRDLDALAFHGLEALASIYAVDISPDNILGGTAGHEMGARQRLLDLFAKWSASEFGEDPSVLLLDAARWIVERNVIVGNLLPELFDGTPTGREDLPLVEYRWDVAERHVSVYEITLGSVMNMANADTTGIVSLFPDIAEPTWSGVAVEIFKAQVPTPPVPNGPVRNGHDRKAS